LLKRCDFINTLFFFSFCVHFFPRQPSSLVFFFFIFPRTGTLFFPSTSSYYLPFSCGGVSQSPFLTFWCSGAVFFPPPFFWHLLCLPNNNVPSSAYGMHFWRQNSLGLGRIFAGAPTGRAWFADFPPTGQFGHFFLFLKVGQCRLLLTLFKFSPLFPE